MSKPQGAAPMSAEEWINQSDVEFEFYQDKYDAAFWLKDNGSGNLAAAIALMEAFARSQVSELEKRIAELTAKCKELDERHVRFMVEGGPVVMSADYDKLQATCSELRARIAELEGEKG